MKIELQVIVPNSIASFVKVGTIIAMKLGARNMYV